jgi:hypothetical protein
MKHRGKTDDEFRDSVIHPPYWFMFALNWPPGEAGMAEAAYAIAPECTSQKGLPENVKDVLAVTFLYVKEHPAQRVVWFTDITRWLGARNQDWFSLGIDWEDALLSIPELPILGLYVTVSVRAYWHLTDAAERYRIHFNDGTSETLTPEERQAVHGAFERQLDADWPPYIRTMLESGRLTLG